MYVNRFDERQLAWSLVDHARPHLSRTARTQLFGKIGAGELDSAIVLLLECCHHRGVELPTAVVDTLRMWAQGYAGTDLESTLRSYLDGALVESG